MLDFLKHSKEFNFIVAGGFVLVLIISLSIFIFSHQLVEDSIKRYILKSKDYRKFDRFMNGYMVGIVFSLVIGALISNIGNERTDFNLFIAASITTGLYLKYKYLQFRKR